MYSSMYDEICIQSVRVHLFMINLRQLRMYSVHCTLYSVHVYRSYHNSYVIAEVNSPHCHRYVCTSYKTEVSILAILVMYRNSG